MSIKAPKILLLTTQRWPFAARLATALAGYGCRVEAVCPGGHVLEHTRAVSRTYPYRIFAPLASVAAGIRDSAADFILPCDDSAVVRLRELSLRGRGPPPSALSALIETSLGSSAACISATRREALMAAARDEQIRVPESAQIETLEDLVAWLKHSGFPTVLKADGTFGGTGVAILHSQDQVQPAFQAVGSRPGILRILKRILINRDHFLLDQLRNRKAGGLIAQQFIQGLPANRAVACWQGEVLAGVSVEAVSTLNATGAATVIRVINNPEMEQAARRLVRRLGLSGLCGFDFMLESKTGAAYLIEANPRATPVAYLALGPDRNPLAALVARLQGRPPPVLPAVTDRDLIALFPGAWLKNPADPLLQTALHDVPWQDPALVQACLDQNSAPPGFWAGLLHRGAAVPPAAQTPLVAPDGREYRPRSPRA